MVNKVSQKISKDLLALYSTYSVAIRISTVECSYASYTLPIKCIQHTEHRAHFHGGYMD